MINNDDNLNNTEVFDDAEIASAYEMEFISKALEKHKDSLKPETHPDFDGTHCIDCEIEIPLFRLGMGKIRCVDCQSELDIFNERKRKLYKN